MDLKIFDKLPDDARQVRIKVFIEEQGFSYEFDDTDNCATHVVAYENSKAIGTCRIFWEDRKDICFLGRMAVLPEYRKKNAGSKIMEKAEEYAKSKGTQQMRLHAQCRAEGFYVKNGYTSENEIVMDEGCPHVWMYKEI